jgi:hypothetical protein
MAMTRNLFFFQNLGAFDCGMDGLCKGGAWGLGQLKDHSKQPNWQCASVSTK